MKILHVFIDNKAFTESVIPFLQEQFPKYNFHFCVFSKLKKNEYNTKKLEGVEFFYKKNVLYEIRLFKALLKKYDIVIFHSMVISSIARMVLSIYKILVKKIVWIAYGCDLYYEKQDNSVKENIKYLVKRLSLILFNKKIPNFVAIHDVDKLQYDKVVCGDAVKYGIKYAVKNQSLPLDCEICKMADKISRNEPIYIQIGHRAEAYLKHIEILNLLSKFKNMNIKIFLPLSYGDMEYGKKVAEKAKSIFGEKAIVMQDFLPYDEYMKILNSVDIFVLNSKRQIALGNIHRFLSLGKKIYLPKDSVLFDYYRENNVPVFDMGTIECCSFNEFVTDVDSDAERDYIKKMYGKDVIELWKNMFEAIIDDK